MKNFKNDFNKLLAKLQNKENFAFIRFSDGELFVLQNKKLELSERGTFIDDQLAGPTYKKEDYKFFDPEQHQEFYEKLWKSFKHDQKNYFIGISCACCVGMKNFQWMKKESGVSTELNNQLTWANLFVNSNYPLFIKYIVPELEKRKIILICNENADLSQSSLSIFKDFRIGRNAMIENADLHLEISKWIEDNNIENEVFLFSASSLTNITVYELYKKHPNNIYLDIGTTLNKQFGFPLTRDYLSAYWTDPSNPDLSGDLNKTCIWL